MESALWDHSATEFVLDHSGLTGLCHHNLKSIPAQHTDCSLGKHLQQLISSTFQLFKIFCCK